MTRTYEQLSAEERGVIMALSTQGSSARAIARTLERAPSTITRELRRNGHRTSSGRALMGRPRKRPGYDAVDAGQRARRVRRLGR
ncbi:helix-turn-helix domain-containing protein, partial [Rhizobacter sp. OV335]|uniref:helix-turn-helix domain-containing protein n=1 Tax=Rhizobacter sp. OV335 TaxID=1500264 RepID=UPI0035180F19